MGKIAEPNRTEALVRLFKHIEKGIDPPNLHSEAHRLFGVIKQNDLRTAEKNLINKGYSKDMVKQLSSLFEYIGSLEDYTDAQYRLKKKLSANHVLQKVLAEHQLIMCFMTDLEEVTDKILKKENLTDTCREYMKFAHIIEHMDAMSEHIDREEDIIFFYLRKQGWTSLCKVVKNEHVYLKIAVNDLIRLLGTFRNDSTADLKAKLLSLTKYLSKSVRDHIFQEEAIVFPIALNIIKDQNVWEHIRTVCEEIDYCGIHP